MMVLGQVQYVICEKLNNHFLTFILLCRQNLKSTYYVKYQVALSHVVYVIGSHTIQSLKLKCSKQMETKNIQYYRNISKQGSCLYVTFVFDFCVL